MQEEVRSAEFGEKGMSVRSVSYGVWKKLDIMGKKFEGSSPTSFPHVSGGNSIFPNGCISQECDLRVCTYCLFFWAILFRSRLRDSGSMPR